MNEKMTLEDYFYTTPFILFLQDLHVDKQQWVWDLAFSADSQYLLTASSDKMARLWSLPTNEVKCEYVGHTMNVTCIAFRDGQVAG